MSTPPPPPQGGHPYGQPPQAPYGQQPQGPYGQQPPCGQQAPYGQAPQPPYGQPPQGPYPGGPKSGFPAGHPSPPPGPRRKVNPNLIKIIGLVGALVIAGIWMSSNTTGPDDRGPSARGAQVSDCVQNTGSEDSPVLEITDCASAEADYRIDERYSLAHSCEAKEGALRYTQSRKGRVHTTLCLSEINR